MARRLRRAGRLMHLRNAQPQVLRVMQIVGLQRLPGVVVDETPRALA